MGQYHLVVNLDKKEFLHPHKLGSGLKLAEQVYTSPGTGGPLLVLLACSHGRGSGDGEFGKKITGRWTGDRIAVIGDYSEAEDIPGVDASKIYYLCCEGHGEYTDISPMVQKAMEKDGVVKYKGTAGCWVDVQQR